LLLVLVQFLCDRIEVVGQLSFKNIGQLLGLVILTTL
jgi:hypothetical protein